MVTGLTACGPGTKQPESQSTVADTKTNDNTQVKEEPEGKNWTDDDSAEISLLLVGGNTPDDRNIVIEELEKQTGTKIKMIYMSHSDYDTKLSTMIAADDPPDIFYCGKLSDVEEYKNAGIITDMEDVLNALAPNVVEETKDVIRLPSVNADGIYLVPNTSKEYGVNICIRKDWLDNLGLDMPADLESFAQAMHAFTYDDPDGNGQNDTIGYSFSLSTMVGAGRTGSNLFGAFGIAKGHPMVMEDGTVGSWVKHPKFLDAVKYIKDLVDDGVCEPGYVSIPNVNMFEKVWNGTSGCIEWECVGPTNNWMTGRYVENPAPEFDFPVIKGPDGNYGTSASYTNSTSGWVFFFKMCKSGRCSQNCKLLHERRRKQSADTGCRRRDVQMGR